MARPVQEWIGKTDTTKIPDRVWLRILEFYDWSCANCRRPLRLVKSLMKDHIIALVNWAGPPPHGNRETNIQPLCPGCHRQKTKADVAEKVAVAKRKKMRSGFRREPKMRVGRKFDGTKRRWNPDTGRWEDVR